MSKQPREREEIIEQAVDRIERFSTITNYTEVGNAVGEAINVALDAEKQATSNAFSKGYDQGYRDALAEPKDNKNV